MASDSAKSHWWNDHARRAIVRGAMVAVAAAVPVVLVNSVAFIGQFSYLNQNVPWPVPARILIAVTVESIAVYLAWHAHLARMANDSAARLALGAYAVALIIGAVNYSHFAHHWHATPLAVIMGLASVISPLLWGVHTKRASRDKLMAQDLVEPHAVRLGANRWMMHAIRSWRAMYWATWHGENSPKIVLAHFAPRYGTVDTPAVPRKSAPVAVRQAVPGHLAVPAIEAAAVPVAPGGPVHPSPGTELNGVTLPAVHSAGASLEAGTSLSGGTGVTEETKAAAELHLASLSYEQASDASERWIARELLGDPQQRRLAKKLKAQRLAAEPYRAGAPDVEMDIPGVQGMIATPSGGGRIG